MPLDHKTCKCGRVYFDWRRRQCRQCRLRPQLCPAAECGRPHRSEYRYCVACRRARRYIGKPYLDDPRADQAHTRVVARQQLLAATADRDVHPYDGPRSARARAHRLEAQRQLGVRICANTHCQRHHRDQTAALCRQCRLVDHLSCAGCHKSFRGEPSAKRCNSCRQRAKRARRRARPELSYFDATGGSLALTAELTVHD